MPAWPGYRARARARIQPSVCSGIPCARAPNPEDSSLLLWVGRENRHGSGKATSSPSACPKQLCSSTSSLEKGQATVPRVPGAPLCAPLRALSRGKPEACAPGGSAQGPRQTGPESLLRSKLSSTKLQQRPGTAPSPAPPRTEAKCCASELRPVHLLGKHLALRPV